jgi:hypothetical protein
MSVAKSALVLFLFLVVVIPIAWFTVVFPYKSAAAFIRNFPKLIDSSVIQQYPSDLVISVKNGQVNLNRPTPYCLILKQGSLIGIVFDPGSEPNIRAFEANGPYSDLCQPLVVVGKNFFMTLDNSQLKIQMISTQLTTTIDQKSLSEFVSNYLPRVTSFGQTAYLYFPFLMVILAYMFFLLNNFWYSFITGLVLKIFKIRPGTGSSEIYGATLFFYTSLNFIQWVVIGYILNGLFKLNTSVNFPFMNTVLIAIACVFYFKSKPLPLPESPPAPPPIEPINFTTVTPPKS